LRKGLFRDGKLIMGLKTIVNQLTFGVGIRRNFSLIFLLHMLFFMDLKYLTVVSLCESWRNIEKIQKNFITYNIKIKGNTPYPILILEASLSPIDNMAMNRYL
jgi:hypothetical protein